MAVLTAGDHLGPYEILGPIGAGGMGAVYKARDTRLDRIVAIKVAQAEFSERFAREARSIAALNHPNICQIYDVGPNYIVMEYVEGAPIAAPDSSRKLLDLAVQIADGMAAAHTAAIVHRDLKPDNILVTTGGRVKILDFGLAKAIAPEKPTDATVTMALTEAGATVGTIAYMSPEQARGEQNLGSQSDQFAFGLILYEMAAGKRAFVRNSRVETMTAIIREEPDPLPASTPAPLKWIVTRLLSKEPGDRYDSSRDLFRELKQIRERLSEISSVSQAVEAIAAPPPVAPKKRSLSWPMLAGGLLVGAAAVYFLAPKPSAPATNLAKYVYSPLSRDEATETQPAWSPDGRSIAYVATVHGFTQIFTRAVGSPEASQITRGNRGAVYPFWSANGASIYFALGDELWVVGATGGTPDRVLEHATTASLHPDGKTFAFLRDSKFWTMQRGGTATEIPLPPEAEGSRVMAGFSPDGTKLAVLIKQELWLLPYPSGTPKKIGGKASHAVWMPDNRRLVTLGLSDLEGKLSILDTADGSERMIFSSFDTTLFPAVSPDGKRIAFSHGRSEWDVMEVGVPSGKVRAMQASGGVSWYPAWAPNGSHFLFATNSSGHWTIEDAPAAEGYTRKVAEGEGVDTFGPVHWSPDGTRFTFGWNARNKPSKVVLSNASGGPTPPLDPSAPGPTGNAIWSPDGMWVMYQRTIPETGELQIARIHPGSTAAPEILATYLNAPDRNRQIVQWSPSGDGILAFGRNALYIVAPDFKSERKLADGIFSVPMGFSKDGKQILALFPNTTGEGAAWLLVSYDVSTGVAKQLGPVDLPVTTSSVRGFSLHPDGTRFATAIARWP
ncbi:MAG: protein kinase, partial [Acidobacteriota bacterium]